MWWERPLHTGTESVDKGRIFWPLLTEPDKTSLFLIHLTGPVAQIINWLQLKNSINSLPGGVKAKLMQSQLKSTKTSFYYSVFHREVKPHIATNRSLSSYSLSLYSVHWELLVLRNLQAEQDFAQAENEESNTWSAGDVLIQLRCSISVIPDATCKPR